MIKRQVQILLFIFLIGTATLASAQCSICAGQVESNAREGNDQAKGLNSAILYLLGAPYLMVIGGGILWYKKYRKKDVLIGMKEEPLHLN